MFRTVTLAVAERPPPRTVEPYHLVGAYLDNEGFAFVSDLVACFHRVLGHDAALRDDDFPRLRLERPALPDETHLNLRPGLIRWVPEGVFAAGNPPLPEDCLIRELIDYARNRGSPPFSGNKKTPPERGG